MPFIDDLRKKFPQLNTWSDREVAEDYARQQGIDLPTALGDLDIKQNKGFIGDVGTGLKRGIEQLPGAVTGLADLPIALATGKRPFTAAADAMADVTGFRPGRWAEDATVQYSPAYQQGQQEINQAWADGSAADIARAYATNPRNIAGTIVESLPAMVGGGYGIGRRALLAGSERLAPGLVGPTRAGLLERTVGERMAAPVAAGIGEGAVTAGQQMDQYTGPDQQRNALASLGAGVITGGIGVGAGRLAQRMGLELPDVALARGFQRDLLKEGEKALPAWQRIGGGALSEGVLQELPQSMQEQVMQNLGAGKPWDEGVARAGVEGTLAGLGMGGAFNIRNARARELLATNKSLDLLGWASGDPMSPDFVGPVSPGYPGSSDFVGPPSQGFPGSPGFVGPPMPQPSPEGPFQGPPGAGFPSATDFVGPPAPAPAAPPPAPPTTKGRKAKGAAVPPPVAPAPAPVGAMAPTPIAPLPPSAPAPELVGPPGDGFPTSKGFVGPQQPAPDKQPFATMYTKLGGKYSRVMNPRLVKAGNDPAAALAIVREKLEDPHLGKTMITPLEEMHKRLDSGRTYQEYRQAFEIEQARTNTKGEPINGTGASVLPGVQAPVQAGTGNQETKDKAVLVPSAGPANAGERLQAGQESVAPTAAPAPAAAPAPEEEVDEMAYVPGTGLQGIADTITKRDPRKGLIFQLSTTLFDGNARSDVEISEELSRLGQPISPQRVGQLRKEANAIAKSIIRDSNIPIEELRDSSPINSQADTSSIEAETIDEDAAFENAPDEAALSSDDVRGLGREEADAGVQPEPEERGAQGERQLGEVVGADEMDARAEGKGTGVYVSGENQLNKINEDRSKQLDDRTQDAAAKAVESGSRTQEAIGVWNAHAQLAGKETWDKLGKTPAGLKTRADWLELYAALKEQYASAKLRDLKTAKAFRDTTSKPYFSRSGTIDRIATSDLEAVDPFEHPTLVRAFMDHVLKGHGPLLADRVGTVYVTERSSFAGHADGAVQITWSGRYEFIFSQAALNDKRTEDGSDGVDHLVHHEIYHVIDDACMAEGMQEFSSQAEFGRRSKAAREVFDAMKRSHAVTWLFEYPFTYKRFSAEDFTREFYAQLMAAYNISAWRHVLENHLPISLALARDHEQRIKEKAAAASAAARSGAENADARVREIRDLIRSEQAEGNWPTTPADSKSVKDINDGLLTRSGSVEGLAAAAEEKKAGGAYAHPGYHGTPHEVHDNGGFKTQKIGTGEGAQAYGWGLYFAGKKAVAQWYRDKLSKPRDFWSIPYMRRDQKTRKSLLAMAEQIKERADDINLDEHATVGNWLGVLASITKYDMNYHVHMVRDIAREAKNTLQNNQWTATPISSAQAIRNAVDTVVQAVDAPEKRGRLYQVELAPEIEDYLDWDKQPSSEILARIPEADQAKLQEILEEDMNSQWELSDLRGTQLYALLKRAASESANFIVDRVDPTAQSPEMKEDEMASRYLNSIGIPGVKFLDASSRGKSDTNPSLKDVGLDNLAGLAYVYDPVSKDWKPVEIKSSSPVRVKPSGLYVTTYQEGHGFGDSTPIDMLSKSPNEGGLHEPLLTDEQTLEAIYKVKQFKRVRSVEDYNYVIFDDSNIQIKAYESRMQKTPFPKEPPQTPYPKEVAKTPNIFVQYVKDTVADWAKSGLEKVVFAHDLADIATKAGLKSAARFFELNNIKAATRTRLENDVDRIMDASSLVSDRGALHTFLNKSTRDGTWGFTPDWRSDAKLDAAAVARFNALSPEAQAVAKDVFRHGDKMARMVRDLVDREINAEFDAMIARQPARKAELEVSRAARLKTQSHKMNIGNGPYAPLKRFGEFVAWGKSQAYMDAEDNDDKTAMAKMQSQEAHYRVEFFNNIAEAKARQRELSREYAFSDASRRQKIYRDIQEVPWGAIAKVRGAVNEQSGEESTKAALNSLLNDIYLTMLVETSARKSEMHRKEVAGESDNMMRAFAAQGRAMSHFISALEHNGEIQDQLQAMRKEARGDRDTAAGTRDDRTRVLNEVHARYAQGLDYRPTPWTDKAMRVTSIWMLVTSPGYLFQNSLQPFMLTLPMLSGRFQAAPATAALFKAYADIAPYLKSFAQTLHIDRLPISTDERAMLTRLLENGKLDLTISQDLGRWIDADNTWSRSKFGQVMTKVMELPQKVEMINRVTSALAAHRLSGGNYNYVSRVIDQTHGNYATSNAPRVMSGSGMAKLIFQFRKYQLIQVSLLGRLMHDAFAGAGPMEKAVARRTLTWLAAHHMVLAGTLGLPAVNLVGMVVAALGGDDDEPKDFERTMREWISGGGKSGGAGASGSWDKTTADLILRGVPAAAGIDLSSKIGMGNAFSILPYTDLNKLDRASYAKAAVGVLGPFFGGWMPQMVDGMGYMAAGDYYKGAEAMMPRGLRDAMRAYRFADQGVTNKMGRRAMSPDEFSAFDIIAQAVGLPTTKVTNRTRLQGDVLEMETYYRDRASELRHDYVRAYRDGDNEAMADARKSWEAMQSGMSRNHFKVTPLSSLLQAPRAQSKLEKSNVAGVEVKKGSVGYAREIAAQ